MLVGPAVVDPGGLDLHGSGPAEDLTLLGVPIANDQGTAILVALDFSRFDLGIDLRLQGVGQHPPCSGAGDLVEAEGEFFAGFAIVVYAEHRCSFPPTLQRRLFRLPSWEGTPRALRNLRSTTSEHISTAVPFPLQI
jgi:hypothetical protein